MATDKKVMIGIPFSRGMSARFHLSITNLAYTLSRADYHVDINYEEGTLLSTQRNNVSKAALDGGYDLLFIDSDMIFAPIDAMRLLNNDKDIIGGLYCIRRAPYRPLVFKEEIIGAKNVFRGFPDQDIPSEPFLCKGLAAGFLLIRHAALEKIWAIENDRPFNFITLPNGSQLGEDLSFFHRCNELGLMIWCDPRGDIGHITERIIYRHHHRVYIRRDHHYNNDIPGWMTVREQNWLYEHAKQMNSIIEIGSWKGKSTHALCCGVNGTVTAIDHFIGTEDDEYRSTVYRGAFKEVDEGIDIYEIFKHNTRMFNNLDVIKMSSQAAFRNYGNQLTADMIFIDGGHEYAEIMADLEAYAPLARKLICGHDYINMPDVQKAVNRYFGQENVQIHETIWYVKK